jgi:tetratricopeptide (TPR) repeat protein
VAVEAMLAGDLETAERAFQQALTLDSRAPEPLSNYAVLARRQGDPATAEERLLASLARRPDFLPALTNLSVLYRSLGRTAEAEETERRALGIKNQNPYYLVGVALRRLDQGELDEAYDLLVRARRIDHTIPEIYLVLGRVDLARGRRAAAARNFALARRRSEELSLDFQLGVERKIERLLLVASAD